jgi:hypothetical protein
VLKLLIAAGVPPDHLSATAFGEHHPLDAGGLLKRSSQAVSTPDACAFRVIVPSRVFRYGPTLGTVQQRVGWQV